MYCSRLFWQLLFWVFPLYMSCVLSLAAFCRLSLINIILRCAMEILLSIWCCVCFLYLYGCVCFLNLKFTSMIFFKFWSMPLTWDFFSIIYSCNSMVIFLWYPTFLERSFPVDFLIFHIIWFRVSIFKPWKNASAWFILLVSLLGFLVIGFFSILSSFHPEFSLNFYHPTEFCSQAFIIFLKFFLLHFIELFVSYFNSLNCFLVSPLISLNSYVS